MRRETTWTCTLVSDHSIWTLVGKILSASKYISCVLFFPFGVCRDHFKIWLPILAHSLAHNISFIHTHTKRTPLILVYFFFIFSLFLSHRWQRPFCQDKSYMAECGRIYETIANTPKHSDERMKGETGIKLKKKWKKTIEIENICRFVKLQPIRSHDYTE